MSLRGQGMAWTIFTILVLAACVSVRDGRAAADLVPGDRLLIAFEVTPGTEILGGSLDIGPPGGEAVRFDIFESGRPLGVGEGFAAEGYLLSEPLSEKTIRGVAPGVENPFEWSGSIYFASGALVLDPEDRFRIAVASWSQDSPGQVTLRNLAQLPPSIHMEMR